MTPAQQPTLAALDAEATRLLMQAIPTLQPFPESTESKWTAIAVFSHMGGDTRMANYARGALAKLKELTGAADPPAKAYSVSQAADMLGIDASRVRHLCVDNGIGTRAPDGSRRLTREDIEALRRRRTRAGRKLKEARP